MESVKGLATVSAAGLNLDVYYHLDGNRAVIDSVELENSVTDIRGLLSGEVLTQIHNEIWGKINGDFGRTE
jgi:hypothetical protein